MLASFDNLVSKLLAVASGICVILFGLAMIRYGVADNFLDHAEPAVAARSWRLVQGVALYGNPASADYQLVAYGPILFLADSAFLHVFGGSLAAAKLAPLVAAGLTVALMGAQGWRVGGRNGAVVSLLLTCAGLMHAGHYAIWNRPEPFLALLVAGSVYGAGLGRGRALAVGVCLGLAINLKFHAALYFIPVLAWYFRGRWIKDGLWIGLVAGAVALLPFAHPLIDFKAWFDGAFGLVAERRPDWDMLPTALRHGTAVIAAPALLIPAAWRMDRAAATYGAILLAVAALATLPALSPGAGWYYMLPLLPVSVDVFLRLSAGLTRWRGVVLAAFALAFLLAAASPQKRLHRNLARIEAESPGAEIIAVTKNHPGRTVAMGVGSDIDAYRRTWVWPKLAFAGHPVPVASWSHMESAYLNQPPPPAKLAHVAECKTDLWLVPKGETPFAMPSYYPGVPAYWPEFRTAFEKAYEKRESRVYFDVWACRAALM